jgi:hypothetical protein
MCGTDAGHTLHYIKVRHRRIDRRDSGCLLLRRLVLPPRRRNSPSNDSGRILLRERGESSSVEHTPERHEGGHREAVRSSGFLNMEA